MQTKDAFTAAEHKRYWIPDRLYWTFFVCFLKKIYFEMELWKVQQATSCLYLTVWFGFNRWLDLSSVILLGKVSIWQSFPSSVGV